jgi:hypothetical protein
MVGDIIPLQWATSSRIVGGFDRNRQGRRVPLIPSTRRKPWPGQLRPVAGVGEEIEAETERARVDHHSDGSRAPIAPIPIEPTNPPPAMKFGGPA